VLVEESSGLFAEHRWRWFRDTHTCSTAADDANVPAIFSYRDSKLTMLLRDSLGGQSLALMIACCTPTQSAAHESLRTLQFAMGVKRVRGCSHTRLFLQQLSKLGLTCTFIVCQVKNKAVVLLSPQEKLIASLRNEIKRLKEENERLRAVSSTPPPPPLRHTTRAWLGVLSCCTASVHIMALVAGVDGHCCFRTGRCGAGDP